MIPFNYVLGEDGLEVKLASRTVRQIKYDDMRSVQPGYLLLNEHWTNFWPLKFISIRRKTGLIKNFVINPEDRELMISQLQQKIEAHSNKDNHLE